MMMMMEDLMPELVGMILNHGLIACSFVCTTWMRARPPPRRRVVEGACARAARRGQLGVLQWTQANGCTWYESTCAMAAKGGHLGVLRWARGSSQGAPVGARQWLSVGQVNM
jgi:hypothetical protein